MSTSDITTVKPTFEALFGMSNAQLAELSDAELAEYLGDALTVAPAPEVVQGKTVISTQMRRPTARSPKHKGPSALAAELKAQAEEAELDAELAELIAQAQAEAKQKPKARI